MFPFTGALCLAGSGSELEELTLPPGAFSLICLALISKARGSGRGPGPGHRGLSQVVLGLFTAQAGQVHGESGRGCGSAAGPAVLPFVSGEPRSRPLPSLGAGCAELSHGSVLYVVTAFGWFYRYDGKFPSIRKVGRGWVLCRLPLSLLWVLAFSKRCFFLSMLNSVTRTARSRAVLLCQAVIRGQGPVTEASWGGGWGVVLG